MSVKLTAKSYSENLPKHFKVLLKPTFTAQAVLCFFCYETFFTSFSKFSFVRSRL